MEGASRSAQEAEARAQGGRARRPRQHPRSGRSGCRGSIFSSAIFASPSPCLIWILPPTPTPAAGDPCHRVSAAWAKGLGSRTGRRVQPGTLVPVSTSQGCRLQDTRSSLGPPVLSLSCRAVECGVRSPAGSPSCLSLTLQD